MITNDSLWKGIIEDLLLDFLTFFYPDQIFNLEKGYDFLDKELEELFPLIDSEHKIRRVDKLIKLFDTTGQERWILIHIYRGSRLQRSKFTVQDVSLFLPDT